MRTNHATMAEPYAINQEVVNRLGQFLANTYVIYVKTQNFHWNIEGEGFYFLHKMLEAQYEELAEAVDEIAERLRALNRKAPGSMRDFLELSTVEEAAPGEYTAQEMIQQLVNDHSSLIRDLHRDIEEANKRRDDGTADLFIQRLRAHEKTAWMLKSHLKQ